MEKITGIFTAYPDVMAVFHKKNAADYSATDPENIFYILYKKHPSCKQLEECAELLQKNTGGNSKVQALNDMDLPEKDKIFLNCHIIYNASQEQTQEYIKRIVKAHAAYKEAASASQEIYKDGFKDKSELEFYYSLLAVPFALTLVIFLAVFFTNQEKYWQFFFGMFTVIFFALYALTRSTRFLDKYLVVFHAGAGEEIPKSGNLSIKRLIEHGNPEKVIKEYRKKINRQPKSFKLNYELALLLEETGDFRGAVLEYQKCYI